MNRASFRHTMNHRDLLDLFRSSNQRCSVKKDVLKTFANFTGKHLCWSLFLITLQVFEGFPMKRFPIKFSKFLRTPVLKNISERLLVFVSPQYTITNSGGEFELDETSTECEVFF